MSNVIPFRGRGGDLGDAPELAETVELFGPFMPIEHQVINRYLLAAGPLRAELGMPTVEGYRDRERYYGRDEAVEQVRRDRQLLAKWVDALEALAGEVHAGEHLLAFDPDPAATEYVQIENGRWSQAQKRLHAAALDYFTAGS